MRGNKQNNLIFRDDAIDATVRWKGNSYLSALRGKPVTLHITGRAAKLCAFHFPPSPPP